MSDFTILLQGLLNPEKTIRSEAEARLEEYLKTSPAEVGTRFAVSMGDPHDSIASLSAVLFRKKILDSNIFSQFDATTKSSLISSLVSLVTPSKTISLQKKIGDILTNIANNYEWSGPFFDLIVKWGSIIELKELTLYLLEISVEFPALLNILEASSDNVIQMLSNFVVDSNPDISLSAVNTLASLLSGLKEETKVMKYSGLSSTIVNVLAAGNSAKLGATLASIANLTEVYPRFWKDNIASFVKILASIATSQIDSDTRSAAVEVLITLVQRGPGMIKKDSNTVIEICQSAMNLAYEIDFKDDVKEWTEDETDLSVTNNDPYSLGKDLLSKASKFLEASHVLPFFLQAIPAFLKDADWAKQHTALLTIGFIAEGCHTKFQENLSELLNMIIPFASSNNPRLVWAFSTTVGLLSTEFEPVIECTYHSIILPALLNILTTNSNIKVLTQTVSALVNFTRGVLTDDNDDKTPVTNYAADILKTLAMLLQNNGSFKLANETLGAISTIATAMEDQFSVYYGEFMPVLKNLVTMAFNTPEQQEVRANCIRCMGHCVESISSSPGEYYEDVKGIINGLISLKAALDTEDPSTLAINEVVSQFADCLKADFLPYLDIFMPDLLSKAGAEVDMAFTDAEVELPTGMKSVSLDFKGQGSKQLAVNTTVLQHKIKACRILFDIVSSVKLGFTPYIEATLKVITPLFTYTFNSDIRKYSQKTAVAILVSQSSQNAESLLILLTPVFIQALNLPKSSPKDIKVTLKALLACLEHVENKAVIGLATANNIAAATANSVKNLFERKNLRKSELKDFEDPDLYTDEIEAIAEEEETDDKILSGVMEIVGMLLKGFKKEFQTTFLSYFKSLYGEIFFRDSATENEILSAVCIFDDYVENTQDLLWSGPNSPILDQMIKYSTHKNANIKQSAVFGLGICAQVAEPSAFSPFLSKSIEAVQTILTSPSSRSEEYTISTDSAVGALGKIAIFQQNSLIESWLNYLPIKSEPEEAQNVHSLFLTNFDKVKVFPRTQTIIRELIEINKQEQVLDQASLALINQISA